MNKQKFKNRLDDSVKLLLAFTGNYCFNELSENCVFTITPNVRIPGAHLNAREISLLNTINTNNGKLYSAGEVVDLLWQDGKVPLWINTSAYSSKPEVTIINLNCSRRLRREDDLNTSAHQYPPFHPGVIQPPDFLKTGNGKYDINWNSNFEELVKPKTFWQKISRFIS
ncbi:MAG: hypothetical protein JWO06_2281 [Bacteroidota bacterium]|nr:hypothetical protein [Bacteroidota bacterium]